MRLVIQKVKSSAVRVDQKTVGSIGQGLMVLLGIEDKDTDEDMDYLIRKIMNLRIFNDAEGVMNRSIIDEQGEILLISQFTLHASTKKGNRPSYIRAAKPDFSKPLYEKFATQLREASGLTVETGIFGAMMEVELINDGPVTLVLDSKNKDF